MKDRTINLTLDRTRNVPGQITEQLRALLARGSLRPGACLPSTENLAQQWATHVPYVHAALKPLVKEGWLERRHGSGTFVCKREERLTCVGIYFRDDVLAKHTSDFLRAIHAVVKEELNQIGVRTQVWVDPRPEQEQAAPWRELCKAAENREIQGLIVPAINWPLLQWLNKLPIPSAYVVEVNIPNKVFFDLRQLAELSLRCLAEQGCRSVGYIGMADLANRFNADGSNNPYLAFFERFTDLAGELGLKIRNEWVRIPPLGVEVHTAVAQEKFGYEEVCKLLRQPGQPEGLVVYPDTTARGVILGLREKQVRVPEELKLVLHKNESFDLLCPMPASFAMLSERAIARALIEQVQKQFRGERCAPIAVEFTLSSAEHEKKR